jgi:uncharacterized protein (TIGR03083 family)
VDKVSYLEHYLRASVLHDEDSRQYVKAADNTTSTAPGMIPTPQSTQVINALANADRDMPCWTWTGVQNVAWIIRRMAHESAVHMWDACQAAGVEAPLQSELSSDGIDEFLHVMLPHAREAQPIVGGSVHVHCTDVEGEWLAVPGDADVMTVTREHAKGSCAIRGTANDLNLLLWRRLSSFDVEVIGDASVAERFLMRTSLD